MDKKKGTTKGTIIVDFLAAIAFITVAVLYGTSQVFSFIVFVFLGVLWAFVGLMNIIRLKSEKKK